MSSEEFIIKGHVTVKEIGPDGEIVSVEEGDNIICVNGATALANSLVTGSMTAFNYMVISTDSSAVSRAHTSISPVTTASTVLTPTILGSITTWTYTFPSGGSATIWKFGMATTAGATSIFNEYLFGAAKDNNTNSLQITYNASMAP